MKWILIWWVLSASGDPIIETIQKLEGVTGRMGAMDLKTCEKIITNLKNSLEWYVNGVCIKVR